MASVDERDQVARQQQHDEEQAPESQVVPVGQHEHEHEPVSQRQPRSEKRGFAAMDAEKQRLIASKGGRAAHEKGTAHEFSKDEARQAGKKGGEVVSRDRSHMAEIGRKGGERVSQDRDHMAQIGRKGGEAVSGDREHMAQIGRKGGEARGSGPGSGMTGGGMSGGGMTGTNG